MKKRKSRILFLKVVERRGFTLIEIIVAVALTVILLLAGYSIMRPIRGGFMMNEQMIVNTEIADTVAMSVELALKKSEYIHITANSVSMSEEYSYLYVKDGHLWYKAPGSTAVDILSADFYGNKTISLTCSGEGDLTQASKPPVSTTLQMDIRVYNHEGKEVTYISSGFDLLNMSFAQSRFIIATTEHQLIAFKE